MIKSITLICSLTVLFFIASCSSNKSNTDNPNAGRYAMDKDKAPTFAPDVSQVTDAIPQYEPYSLGGNPKKYTVMGKSYQVLDSGKDYTATGIASWYGLKFHGHLTSNGEVYDMYSMSAAHKTLPLPSFVKVTNTSNGKTVIVRVNDRGPFHQNRLIDLSYAAAYKLDMLDTGTAKVKIEVIYIPDPTLLAISDVSSNKQHYIQVFASADKKKINQLAKKLSTQYQLKSRLQTVDNLYRLQLGPIGQQQLATELADKLKNDGYPNSYLVIE
ncbi:septal ring lytic transglycosylase RlpA family protein [uncultured Shewanella sp.]|uniref:septal ring lytic transglycosylase RlpA family protein n=1 Tax=uncultured Shewanella sp. TaxID=173975 RepID=UPI00263454B7|nr:septal ring lytic transglycosylase RlpA family protein [uncultured Shewanella sp.]